MFDTEIKSYEAEFQRIKKLSEFDLDYLELQDELKNLVDLAKIIAGTEISVLNLIDDHFQWSVSANSTLPNSMPREDSVCQYTIDLKNELEIPRLDLDSRFDNKDYVKGIEGFRYYLGIPLTLASGENIGALCVLDRDEMSTPEQKKNALKLIAAEIVEKLETKKRLNEAIFSYTEAIQARNQAAHDIRGPLNGIAGLAEVVESEDLSNEEMKEYFRLIKESGNGLLELTEEILNSAKVSKTIKSRYINLPQLKEKLLKLYNLPVRSKNISFQISADPEKARYSFPKRKLLCIAGNLISNAIKFTPAHGKVSVDLDIVNTEAGKFKTITVTDTGKGFSEAEISDFYNDKLESSVGVEGEKGFGLGLKLVHEMVNDLGGTMEITSRGNRGAKIEVRLPLS